MGSNSSKVVAVIGAGPVGLAAAAHLHAYHQPFVVLEAGAEAGAAVREWGHVRTFGQEPARVGGMVIAKPRTLADGP